MKSTCLAICLIAILVALVTAQAQDPIPFPSSRCVSFQVNEGSWSPIYYLGNDRIGRQITVTQSHAAGSFDPDVYYRWNQIPTRSDYDGADFSTETTAALNIYPTDEQRTEATTKLHIGVYSYSGSGSVEICVDKYNCLNKNCGAEVNTCNADTGKCDCQNTSQWAGDYCQVQISPGTFAQKQTLQVSSGKVMALKFSTEQQVGELQFDITRPASVYSDVICRARRGAIPTDQDFDFEERVGGFTNHVELFVERHAYAPGDWYVTFETSGNNVAPFSIEVMGNVWKCPRNCFGHGVCQDDGICKCDPGFIHSDCSYYSTLLVANETLAVSTQPYQTSNVHFNITQQIEDLNVEVLIKYTADEPCGTTCPRLYITPSGSASSRASKERFVATSRLPAEQNQAISITDHDLRTSIYTVAIVNPSYAEAKGKIEIHYVPHCPNSCSGHGSCSWEGHCFCHDGWYSTDCSVNDKVCTDKLPSKSGVGKGALFLVIIIGIAIGAVAGVFIFKLLVKNSTSAPKRQLQLQADDQYAQLT